MPSAIEQLMESGAFMPMGPQPAAQPQQQPAEPPDPVDYFHVNGPIPADDPMYAADRDMWYEAFADGYYQRDFRDVNDYIEYVESIGGHPGIDAFAKKQALKHMPPKLKQEYEEMQAERKAMAKLEQQFEMIQRFNQTPQMRDRNMMAELGPKGEIKFTALKEDAELKPHYRQMEMTRDLIKVLEDKSKSSEGRLPQQDRAKLDALYDQLIQQQQKVQQTVEGRQIAQQYGMEDVSPQSVLQAVAEGRMSPEEAKGIGIKMGF